jgi:hypothetical protein
MDRKSYIPGSPYLTDNLTDHPEELSLLLLDFKTKKAYSRRSYLYAGRRELAIFLSY